MNETTARLAREIAARLSELIRDELRAMEGTELHADLAVIVACAMRGYLERQGLPELCRN